MANPSAPLHGPTRQAFEAAIDFLEDANRVLHLATTGIAALRGVGGLAEALAEHDQQDDAETAERVKRAHEDARLAAEEVAAGFPLLLAHTVVAMWSTLETVIPAFAAAWLAEYPQTLERPAFEKLRVPAVAVLREEDEQQRMTPRDCRVAGKVRVQFKARRRSI